MAANEVSVNVYDHGTVIDKKKGRMQCNYCGKVVSGSSRLKFHLGGIRGDVTPCMDVPESVKELIRKVLLEKRKGHLCKEVGELDHPNLPWKRNLCHQMDGADDGIALTSGSRDTKRVKMESASENNGIKSVSFPSRRMEYHLADDGNQEPSVQKAKECIGRFFYETGIDFSAAILPSFQRMMNSTFGCDKVGHMIPSCQELKGWILQNALKDMQHYVQKIRNSWVQTGCSILLDGWIDEKGRELVNILVDCPQGAMYLHSFDISAFVGEFHAMHSFIDKVLKEVGVNNVVQIISYSTSEFMKTFGDQVMEKYRTLFWTTSASHCIELMLEEMQMMNFIKDTIEKAKRITKFIYNHTSVLKLLKDHTRGCDLVKRTKVRSAATFVTLENILLEEDSLKKMFTSSEWNTSIWVSTEEGKSVTDLVTNCFFWSRVRKVVNSTIPLVRVLEIINDGDNKQLGYIYETIDQAKETIKEELRNKSDYMPFWKVIDHYWNNHLHSHLHSAGYFLNPSLFYSDDFLPDPEVINGTLYCIVRMAESMQVARLISSQLDPYRQAKGDFSHGNGITQRTISSPAIWWSTYGGDCPELQKFATRVLSQTCSGASRYALNRSLAEKLLDEGRNHLEQQRISDLTFLHYNMQLQNFQCGVTKSTLTGEIDPMDDWIVDKVQDVASPNGVLTLIDLDGGATTTCGRDIDGEGSPSVSAEEEPK